jgi:hypothetical protein
LDTFEKSVERFLEAADWLDETDQPMITALKQAAQTLDSEGVQAALLNTFGVTYRTLLKKREKGNEGFNDDEDFLNGL